MFWGVRRLSKKLREPRSGAIYIGGVDRQKGKAKIQQKQHGINQILKLGLRSEYLIFHIYSVLEKK